MRYLQIFILSFLILSSSTSIIAQDAYHQRLLEQLEEDYDVVGGEWMVSDNEFTTLNSLFYWGLNSYTLENADGQIFTQAVSATISELEENRESGIGIINNQIIEAGDRLLINVWMRGTTATEDGAMVRLLFEGETQNIKEADIEVKLSKEWQQYLIPFEAKNDFDYWEAFLSWNLSAQLQTVEIGGLAILNYGKTYELHEIPEETHITYDGRETDAAWRISAAERIDLYRKSNLEVLVVDENGKPVKNATISVKMQQHDYVFGTSIESCAIAGNECHDDFYQQKILDLDGRGHGFNQVVFENAFDWNNWEESSLTKINETINALQWLQNQDIEVRGQSLLSPSWDNMPSDLLANKNDIDYLKTRIDQRLEAILQHPTIAENVKEWDVLDGLVKNKSLESALAGKDHYSTGRELYAEIFEKARQKSPKMRAYLNDCVAICEAEEEGGDAYQDFKNYIQEILDEGEQIDGIGFEAHIGSKPISPEAIYDILEDFYQIFGLKTKVTEFNMASITKGVSADYMHDFLTVVFSHPSTEGFLMSGFWDEKHELGDAPIFDQNWNLKPSGESFVDLVFRDWWTNETLIADENGQIQTRAFKGDYDITVVFNGETYSTTSFQLKSDETLVIELPIATNIEEIENQNRFLLFPNPSMGDFQLQYDFPQNNKLEFEVYNPVGRQLQAFSKNVIPQRVFRHSFELPVGIYFVKVKDGNRVMVEKVVVN